MSFEPTCNDANFGLMHSTKLFVATIALFFLQVARVIGNPGANSDSLPRTWPSTWHVGSGGRFVRFENLRDGFMPKNYSWFSDPYNRITTNLSLQRSLPKNTLRVPFELRAGILYERLIFDQEGTIDVEYWSCQWLNCNYLGETMKLRHDISTLGTELSAMVLPYKNRRFLGTSLSVYTNIRYLFVTEREELSMNGAYQEDPSTGDLLSYQTEYFDRTRRADQLGWEAGVRFEIYLGKHFSVLIPQVGFQQSLELRAIPSTVYTSKLDGDQLILSKRSNNLNKSSLLFGLNFHFF